MEPPFERTTCGCAQCVSCCRRKAGPVTLGQIEQVAEYLGQTVPEAMTQFEASAGSVLMNSHGRMIRVGSITPKMRHGQCIFLDRDDRCRIHPVAPVGCSHFDMHMTKDVALPRSVWMARHMMSEAYQALRRQLVKRRA